MIRFVARRGKEIRCKLQGKRIAVQSTHMEFETIHPCQAFQPVSLAFLSANRNRSRMKMDPA